MTLEELAKLLKDRHGPNSTLTSETLSLHTMLLANTIREQELPESLVQQLSMLKVQLVRCNRLVKAIEAQGIKL